jgi:RNA polymerase sigma-70 factor, Bacteroides expansion family 1
MQHSINGKELVSRVIVGDEAAFAQLFNLYRNKLYSFIYHLSGSASVAEDILQETFLKIWRDREQLAGIENFNAYLYRMAQNHAINVLRRQSREALLLHELRRLAPEGVQGDAWLAAKEVQKALQQAIDQLPPQQRKVYQLGREQGFSYGQIAQSLNISVSTVRNHMVQALKAIREYIARHYPALLILTSLLSLLR